MKQIEQESLQLSSFSVMVNVDMHFRKYIIIFLFTLVGIGIMGYGYVYAAGSNGGFEVPDINDEIGDYKPVTKPNKTDSLDRKECIMIKSIQANLPEDASVSQIATLYNNINATTVNDYGARVAAVYKSQPWK